MESVGYNGFFNFITSFAATHNHDYLVVGVLIIPEKQISIMHMKNILAILVLLIGCSVMNAQSITVDTYIKITYLNVEPAAIGPFLESVESNWKQMQASRVDAREIQRWHLYRVPYSGDRHMSYNFVSVEMAENLNALQSEDRKSTREYRNALRKAKPLTYVVHTEIWKTMAVVHNEGKHLPSRYMNVNYMSASSDKLDEYLHLETEIASQLHAHQMKNGRMDGWAFHRLVFPTGVSSPFNFITADFYSNLEQIEMGITRQVIEEVHPDMNVDEFEYFADSIRERVHSDLWELLEYALPK